MFFSFENPLKLASRLTFHLDFSNISQLFFGISRYVIMLNARSFSEILKEFNTEDTDFSSSSSHDTPAFWESHLDASGLAQLMGNLNISLHPKIPAHKAYPPKPQALRLKTLKIQRPSHKLTDTQLIAFNSLKAHCPKIQNNFNRNELKSAYRLAVLKTHPDQGGTSEIFQDVKKSYQILLALVKNEA